jgi:hypothetical protein
MVVVEDVRRVGSAVANDGDHSSQEVNVWPVAVTIEKSGYSAHRPLSARFRLCRGCGMVAASVSAVRRTIRAHASRLDNRCRNLRRRAVMSNGDTVANR